MATKSTTDTIYEILHAHDFRATDLRIKILEILASSPRPLTISDISKKTRKLRADTVTLYRALEAFVAAGIVRELQLIKQVKSFDFVGDTHTHHIVCTSCNLIEPISFCVRNIETSAKEKSKLFKKLDQHQLSFSGTCKKCARAVR